MPKSKKEDETTKKSSTSKTTKKTTAKKPAVKKTVAKKPVEVIDTTKPTEISNDGFNWTEFEEGIQTISKKQIDELYDFLNNNVVVNQMIENGFTTRMNFIEKYVFQYIPWIFDSSFDLDSYMLLFTPLNI